MNTTRTHFLDSDTGKEVSRVLAGKSRFSFHEDYVFVRDGKIPEGGGERYAEYLSDVLRPLGFVAEYRGFDDEDYVFRLIPIIYEI